MTMSTQRGVVTMYNRPAATTRAPLPIELLLEIAARSDVTTIIRSARASKFLRGAILDPAFRRHLALQAPPDDGGGFDPALLLAVSYMSHGPQLFRAHHIIHTPSSSKIPAHLPACSILCDSFEPVASRDRLLLLRLCAASPQPPSIIELRVCDAITGHVTFLPNVTAACYAHAFLGVSDAGASYELIVTDKDLQFQTFSSQHGQWTAVREPSVTRRPHRLDASSRVIGRTDHWLCHRPTLQSVDK